MSNDLAQILYVDDEEHNLTAFRASFRRDFVVHTAINAAAGEALLDKHPIEVIVTDQRMPEATGVEFLERIRQRHPDPIRIVLTGYADIEAIIDAINRGQVYRYVAKPWEQHVLKWFSMQPSRCSAYAGIMFALWSTLRGTTRSSKQR